jgi:type I restriction enzyme S subunit
MHGLRAGSPTTLGDVAQFVRNGVMYKRGDATGGLPVTRIETMSAGEIDLERVGYIGLDESTGSEFLLAAGDILFSNKNSLERVGTTALVAPEHLPLINGDNVLQIRLREQAVPEFVLALLRSTECREYIRSVTRPAVNQASVNAAQVRAIPLWMPDLSAQAEWGGAYVESLRLLRGLRENQRAASLLRERLLQNLLFGAIEIPSTCDALLGEVA